MKSLIILVHGVDVHIFTSLSEVESYIEPIDAKMNDYKVFDSEGMLYNIAVYKIKERYFFGLFKGSYEIVKVTPNEDKISHKAELHQYLCEHFEAIQMPRSEWQALTTDELLNKLAEMHKIKSHWMR
jgi:hypothetical protein